MSNVIHWTEETVIMKDPTAEKFYHFSWARWLVPGATINGSTWEITDGPDSALEYEHAGTSSDELSSRLRLKGGTVGATYTLRNKITTNESPSQTDRKSVRVTIAVQ